MRKQNNSIGHNMNFDEGKNPNHAQKLLVKWYQDNLPKKKKDNSTKKLRTYGT